MNEFCAAMGICNLRHLDDWISDRKIIVNRYRELLTGIPGLQLCEEQEGIATNYSYFPIVIHENEFGRTRDEVTNTLFKNGIVARKYFYPLTSTFECYHGRFDPNNTPVALYISKRVITLPLYPELSPEEVDRICDVIKKSRV